MEPAHKRRFFYGDFLMYFTKQWTDSLQLPDGSVVSSATGLDKYLKDNDLSLSQDYSEAWLKQRRRRNEKAQREELLSDFIHNYKRSIWND